MESQDRQALDRDGHAVVKGLTGGEVESFLGRLGRLLPQYDGRIAFEVRPKAAFDRYRFSQSMNPIGPHTEAPVHDPPPRYLALFCHRQATCGGGATSLSDGSAFLAGLPPPLRQAAETMPIEFIASRHPGGPVDRVARFPMLSAGPEGASVFRFSHNQFYFGDVNPTANDEGDGNGAAPVMADETVRALAARGADYFTAHAVDILIPVGGLLIWDNHRMTHARGPYKDPARHLTRYWIA